MVYSTTSRGPREARLAQARAHPDAGVPPARRRQGVVLRPFDITILVLRIIVILWPRPFDISITNNTYTIIIIIISSSSSSSSSSIAMFMFISIIIIITMFIIIVIYCCYYC